MAFLVALAADEEEKAEEKIDLLGDSVTTGGGDEGIGGCAKDDSPSTVGIGGCPALSSSSVVNAGSRDSAAAATSNAARRCAS